MDKTQCDSKNPDLSKYFINDPPSVFDEISDSENTQKMEGLLDSTFTGSFLPAQYVDSLLEQEDSVSEDVQNCWISPISDSKEQLMMPGVSLANPMEDHIVNVVKKYLGAPELSYRNILDIDDVSQDNDGIRSLISAGCYRAALNLTGRLLTICGQGFGRAGQPSKHTSHSLQLWFTRLALLIKLGEYEILQTEAEPFGQLNSSDAFYDFYSQTNPGKKGSMACFSFRLLLAELPIYFGNPQSALDRLSRVYMTCCEIKRNYTKQSENVAEKFWQKQEMRVLHSIVNCAIIMKKFNLIDDIISGMIIEQLRSREERRALFSAWGRIYLQIGDIFGAEQKFAEARRLREVNSQPDLRDLVDKGLITVARNDFPEAYTIFQKALHLDSGNTMILNNMGVSLLYAGKLKDSIKLFEHAISLNPQRSLNESLLVNLSTLYELQSNNARNKKLNLLRLINRYKPDLNINTEICLKLQSSN